MATKPSYELAVGTHLITTKPGRLSLACIIGAAADATISCYDVDDTGDIAAGNKLIAFKVDVSLNGFQGGGNINSPLSFATGLVVVVAGTAAVGYVGYSR